MHTLKILRTTFFKLRKRRQIAEKLRLEIHYSDGFKSEKIGKLESISSSSVILCVINYSKKQL